jgi:hypothetical protein
MGSMHETTKVVPLGDYKFQINKLPADVGSFILMRLMGEASKAAQNAPPAFAAEPSKEPVKEITPEDRVRALCFVVFSGTMEFSLFQFIQKHCMMVVRKLEGELPMPIMSDDGRWVYHDLAANHSLLVQLMIEVCIFNFAGFFAENGAGVIPKP